MCKKLAGGHFKFWCLHWTTVTI